MRIRTPRMGLLATCAVATAAILGVYSDAFARDVEYDGGEIVIKLAPGEPTQIEFGSNVSGGFKKKDSPLAVERRGSDIVLFSRGVLPQQGESMIVRLEDGRSYAIRATVATDVSERDAFVKIIDSRAAPIIADEEEVAPYKEKAFPYAPPTVVSGFMREIILASEFGKGGIPGYRVTDKYTGEKVLDDGTLLATIDKIFIGPEHWGYVLNVENRMNVSQRLNPATFRLDGTRAISMQYTELAAKPLNAEQQLAGRDRTKVYIITRARK